MTAPLSADEAVALPMPLHYVEWPEDERPTFTCTAEVGAACRLHCAVACGAEAWPCGRWEDETDEEAAHPMIDSGECIVLLFLSNADDHDQDRYSGPIKVRWEDDFYAWEPAVTGGLDANPQTAVDGNDPLQVSE